MTALTAPERLQLHGLHCLCRLALRAFPPLRAKALVDRFARPLQRLDGVESARAAVLELSPAGSCLSRAMTIAATMPCAEVVIGIDAFDKTRVSAHAWLEIGDARIDVSPGRPPPPPELARFPPAGCSR